MKLSIRIAALGIAACFMTNLSAQISLGGKVGTNYLLGSQKIQPEPKNAPTNPKGLGLSFGAFMNLPFSDLVGLRPELEFSFRRGKTEITENTSLTNNTEVTGGQGAFTGTRDYLMETDQRLSYFMVNVPLTLKPTEGLRIMLGPSMNFLMGGKVNDDQTITWKGTITAQGQQTQQVDQQNFEATKKKGGSAIKDYKKADIMVLAGLGYTLPVGLDMDLRYYRGLSPTFDHTAGTARTRIWTNLIEFSVGWQFGG